MTYKKSDLIGHIGEISPVFPASSSADEQEFWLRTDLDGRHWIYDGPDKMFCLYFPHNNPIEQAWKYVNKDKDIDQVLLRWCAQPYCVRPGHTYLGSMEDWIESQHRFLEKHELSMESAVLVWMIYKQGVKSRYIAKLLGLTIKSVKSIISCETFVGAEQAAHQELIDIQYDLDWYNRSKLGTTLKKSRRRLMKQQKAKEHYQKHKERYKEKAKKWRDENKDRDNAIRQRYRDLHREEVRAYQRQYWRDKRSPTSKEKLKDLGVENSD